jgi:tRNA (guanine-N1)-methyltransferase
MNFHVLTLFPEMVSQGLNTSIIGRAAAQDLISINTIDIREYSKDKHRHVDDYPYGGGAGMVMQAEPIYNAYAELKNKIGKKPRVIYVTPQGSVFNQNMAKNMAQDEDLVFLCGHYEGVDERILDLIVTDYVSIGDYVLTGGELPAMVMIDCISRLVSGVLSNKESGEQETFSDNLLEYPQYTRPKTFMGMDVPEILLSGHHKKIGEWQREQSVIRTAIRRPDLLSGANLTNEEKKIIGKILEEIKD